MITDPSPEIVVPIRRELPTLGSSANWIADLAAYLLTHLLYHESAMLHADFRATGEQWFLQHWTTTVSPVEAVIVAPDRPGPGKPGREQGVFRAILNHFAMHYMAGQVYGGYSELSVRQNNQNHHLVIYMANDSWRGYWIRIFARREGSSSDVA